MSRRLRKNTTMLTSCFKHDFSTDEVKMIRRKLLKWYDKNQRQLPWREVSKIEEDDNIRGYSTWVSETMLQQTQVKTVVDYYHAWMEKFPTVQHLAASNLEEVNRLWAGLGYYSRARRLFEGAQILANEMNGNMPQKADNLLKIPGIGRYTSSAVASIAYGQPVGVVDGNVSRVLSRLRVIGKDIKNLSVVEKNWQLANQLVCPSRPGDFNQALMELGAILCTPRNPDCTRCPVQAECLAYRKMEKRKEESKDGLQATKINGKTSQLEESNIQDIENGPICMFCLPEKEVDDKLGVCCYPQKGTKKPPRKEHVAAIVIECTVDDEQVFLVTKRPEGLLANLWEFPCILLDKALSSAHQEKAIVDWLGKEFDLDLKAQTKRKTKVGEVIHQFSHIHTTYQVHHLLVQSKSLLKLEGHVAFQWLTKSSILQGAVSTAMKKVFFSVSNHLSESKKETVKRKRSKRLESSKKIKQKQI